MILGQKFIFQNIDFWEKHLETNEYVLIHPELQKNIFRPNFAAVLYNFVQYGIVQYRVPPPHTKVNFFSLHFWMNQAICNVFPMLLEKTLENPKKKFGIGQDPPPNFQTF